MAESERDGFYTWAQKQNWRRLHTEDSETDISRYDHWITPAGIEVIVELRKEDGKIRGVWNSIGTFDLEARVE